MTAGAHVAGFGRKMGRIGGALLFPLFLIALSGCSERGVPKKVSLDERETTGAEQKKGRKNAFRIAVGGMITPREGFIYYRKLLDYIGDELDQYVEFVDREDYAGINALLKSGEVDLAFVCGGPYVDGREGFGMTLLVAPESYGGSVYYSYIIVGSDSPLREFDELRGKSFAFTDPLSNSGKLVPTYMLARMGEEPETFFSRIVYTSAHDKSIKAVAQGLVDAAAVDSLIWEYAHRKAPEYTSRTRIIRKSPPYGIPPVVVRSGMDPELTAKLREIFLRAHENERGGEILKGMMIDRFVEIEDSAYDSIREMKAWVQERNKAGKGAERTP